MECNGLFHDDAPPPRGARLAEMIVETAGARQVQRARVSTLARLKHSHHVDGRTLVVHVDRIGHHRVWLRVVVDESHLTPCVDAHFAGRYSG